MIIARLADHHDGPFFVTPEPHYFLAAPTGSILISIDLGRDLLADVRSATRKRCARIVQVIVRVVEMRILRLVRKGLRGFAKVSRDVVQRSHQTRLL